MKQIGATDELINLCLRKADWPYSIDDIRRRLRAADFRPKYLSLPLGVQELVDDFLDYPEG